MHKTIDINDNHWIFPDQLTVAQNLQNNLLHFVKSHEIKKLHEYI